MRKSNLLFWVILWLFAGGATAQTVKNPLSIVAEYNLKSDGTFAKWRRVVCLRQLFQMG